LLKARIYFQVQLIGTLVGGGAWHPGRDIDMIDALLELVKISALRALLGGSLALVSTSDGLRVALDNHRLEWEDLLLISSLINV
jgi:hypothetical protein